MNKLALITGASRGIGKETAEVFAKNGFNLALVCRKNADKLKEHAARLTKEYGIEVHCYFGDVADHAFIESIRDDLAAKNSRGCGSKIMATLNSCRAFASVFKRCKIWRCPK